MHIKAANAEAVALACSGDMPCAVLIAGIEIEYLAGAVLGYITNDIEHTIFQSSYQLIPLSLSSRNFIRPDTGRNCSSKCSGQVDFPQQL